MKYSLEVNDGTESIRYQRERMTGLGKISGQKSKGMSEISK
jgi:hypothetical protein